MVARCLKFSQSFQIFSNTLEQYYCIKNSDDEFSQEMAEDFNSDQKNRKEIWKLKNGIFSTKR